MDQSFIKFVDDNILSIDLINIAPLDDLHSPKGFIKEVQALAAKALLIINPTYFGFAEYLNRIVGLVQSRNIIIIVGDVNYNFDILSKL